MSALRNDRGQAVVAGAAEQPAEREAAPLDRRRVVPVKERERQAEQGHADRLPDHDHAGALMPCQALGQQKRGREDRCRRQHHEVVDAAATGHLRRQHDQHAGQADAGGEPALPTHRFLEEDVGADHDEDRSGEADRRHVGERDLGQRGEPQAEAEGVDRTARELAAELLRPVAAQAAAQHQRQHHDNAEQIAQELGLERIELLGEKAHQRVQMREHEAGCGCPHQAADRARQGGRMATRVTQATVRPVWPRPLSRRWHAPLVLRLHSCQSNQPSQRRKTRANAGNTSRDPPVDFSRMLRSLQASRPVLPL